MPDADETIITKFIVEADEALEETEELRKEFDAVKKQLKEFAVSGKESFEVVRQGMQKAFAKGQVDEFGKALKGSKEKIRDFGKASGQALKEVNAEARQFINVMKMFKGINLGAVRVEFQQTRDATVSFLNSMKGIHQATQPFNERLRGMIGNLGQLRNVGQFVFGTMLGVTAVQALRKIVDLFKEALQSGLEYQRMLFTLEVAVRGLQRVGLETTISGWLDKIEKFKKQFPIFPRREFTEAATLAALMTREFGFTEDQIADIVRQSAILSEITGKDLFESVRGITYAIGSGYFESLQRAGINISRAVVANEALAQGYEGVYNELEPVIRASITYSVIQNNLNALQEDAGRRVETTEGQVRRLESAWQDLLDTLGLVVVETDEAKESIAGLALAIETLREAVKIFETAEEVTGDFPIKKTFLSAIPALNLFLDGIAGINVGLEDLYNWLVKLNLLAEKETLLGDIPKTIDIPETRMVGGIEISAERYQELVKASQELAKEILEIEQETAEKRQDILDDFMQDSVRKWKDHQDKLLDLEEDFGRRLVDIDTRAQQQRDDAIADLAFKIAEVARNAAFRKEEAERKFRDRELKSERKFQEKLRQLRENFLFDLEDAVRERDARQIIRSIRQFNLRRDQMIRDEKLNKDDRSNAFAEELRQIEFQRQERLRQLAIEHERRLQSIDLQAERERARAKIEFERRQQAEKERFERQKEDQQERLGKQLDDADEAAQDRTDKIIEGLQKEYDLTDIELQALGDLYNSFYGPNGMIPSAIQGTINKMQELRMMMATVMREQMMFRIRGVITNPALREAALENAGEQAEGGSIVARKPTVAIFGEAGPEMATFTPLNKLDRASTFGGQSPVGSKGSLMGKLRLEMLLSPDLEARIIDDTLDEVADVIYTVERERR